DVIEVDERATLPETLLDVLDVALNLGFILRMTHTRRVDQEATRLAVFEKSARRSWLQQVRSRDRRGKVIQHQAVWRPAEEAPGVFESVDDLVERLAEQWPDERMATVRQDHYQRPHQLAALRGWVDEHTQATEVHLGDLAGRGLGHAQRDVRRLP